MNIKVKPFVVGSLMSIVFLLVINVVSLLVTRSTMFATLDFDAAPDPNVFLASSLVSVFSCLCGIASVSVGAGVYAYLHNQESPIDVQDGLVGGGAVGATAYLVSGIVGALLNFLLLPDIFDAAGLSGELGVEVGAMMAVSGIVGAVIGLCFSLVLGGGIGAGAGALTASLLNRN
jgi:hypothetical protein